MAEKQTNKDRMREIVDSIENGIKELFESDKYRQYLSTMSRFHRYSVNNTMLIYMQRPDATHVAGFNKWRNQFGRNVLKGEKGIRIIAPTPYKKKVEEIKTDPETNAPVLDADGKAIIEEKEIRIPMFKVVSVFDVSQTAGKPLPQLAADLSGNVQQYEVFMEALRRASPVPMEIKPVARDTDGFFSIKAQSITIRAGMSEVQTVCAAVHEIAHAKLHDYEHMTELADDGETILVPGEKSRNTEEVEAESISYAVCQYYGIETGENSFGYIATWSKGKELKELRASLETINKTASELITDIDRNFAEICKERGISVEKSEQSESQLKENSNMSAADLAKSISELYLDANGLAFLSEFASQEDCLQHFYEDLLTGADEIKGFLSETLEQSDEYAHRANELLLEVEAFQESHTSLKELDANERWYAVDGGSKHLRITEDGAKYAYELYDKDTLHLLESGTVHDDDVNFLLAAAIRICETHGYDKTVPFEVLSNEFAGILYSLELSSDDNQVVHEEAGSHAAGTLPTSPELEQATPMPDPTLTVDDMRSYGYLDSDMLPLSKDRAVELLEHDITVYMLYPDNAEEMVFEAEDIIKHDGMFGVTRPDWDAVKGHIPPRDVEQRFLNSPTDSMAIYQLRRDAPVELRFANLGSLAAPPDPANYEAVYTREVYPDDDTGRILENFYYIFNDERPGDFVGHSLSVSDIVALKQNGKVSYHYCDSMGFQELPAFQKPENYLKAAEMSMEDDYGMIDGIINNGSKQPTVANLEAQVKAGMSISLMDLAAAAHRERDAGERKPSVLEQLKSQPAQERPHKTAPKKSAEKEL
jgi:antirestriction protein ArdC